MAKSNKQFVTEAVRLAQENLFLRMVNKEMVNFIIENGVLNFSTDKRGQEALVKNYFKHIALDKIAEKGFEMGVNTPWGKDAGLLTVEEDGLINSFEEEDDDVDEEN